MSADPVSKIFNLNIEAGLDLDYGLDSPSQNFNTLLPWPTIQKAMPTGPSQGSLSSNNMSSSPSISPSLTNATSPSYQSVTSPVPSISSTSPNPNSSNLTSPTHYSLTSPSSYDISPLSDTQSSPPMPFNTSPHEGSFTPVSPNISSNSSSRATSPKPCQSTSSQSPCPSPKSSTSQVPPPLLPPCRVCGEKASGFHYGANTCEACKGFFRRSLARKANYRCAGNEDCEIEPGKRSVCAYCRYQKCLSIGMSKDAIKTGRYTHEKKTRDIEEVKRIQKREQQHNKARGITQNQSGSASLSSREVELEKIIKHITAAHLQQTPHPPDFFQKLPQKEAEYLEKRDLQEKMFGPMKPIPREEYQQIYQSTGIDVDGRREMISSIIPCIERAIKRFISFAKALPGFKDLPIEDQIALIKGSRFDTWFFTHYRMINVEHKLFTFSHEPYETIGTDKWLTIASIDYILGLVKVCSQIRKMHLQVQEIALLKAIAIFSPVTRTRELLISLHRSVNLECDLLTTNWGETFHKEDLKKIHTADLVDRFFHCAGLLKPFHLQVPEMALLEGIVLTSTALLPVDIKLKNPDGVDACRAILCDTLKYWFSRTRPDDPGVLDRLLLATQGLTDLCSLSVAGAELLATFFHRPDLWLLGSHRAWNAKEKLYTSSDGKTMGYYEMSLLNSTGYLDQLFQIIPYIQGLKLQIPEIALMQGIALFAPAHRPDTWVIGSHRAWNVKHRLYTCSEGITMGYKELALIHSGEDIDDLFGKVKMVQDLELHIEEIALLQAITFMSPVFVDSQLKAPAAVLQSQDKIGEALYYWVKKTRPGEPFKFLQIIQALSQIMELKIDSKSLQSFRDWSDLPLPQLLVDTWMN